MAYDIWCAMKPWQRDKITATRKVDKDIQPLVERYT